MCQSVEELLVYDFDGTLADTPTPITGKEMYKRKTGVESCFGTFGERRSNANDASERGGE